MAAKVFLFAILIAIITVEASCKLQRKEYKTKTTNVNNKCDLNCYYPPCPSMLYLTSTVCKHNLKEAGAPGPERFGFGFGFGFAFAFAHTS